MDTPICPHCGKPLRKRKLRPKRGITVSSINNIKDKIVPWNYGWDGKCENCGHDFNIVMNINMGETGAEVMTRQTTVKVGCSGYAHQNQDFIIEAYADDIIANTVLSGVVIETKDISWGGLKSQSNGKPNMKVFLSANELKYLINALKDSPILKQLDYLEEGELHNMFSKSEDVTEF